MSGTELGLAISVFLACAVEAVEALTIVLAVGTTRSWSAAMSGVGVATVTLAAIVAALGPALTTLPIDVLRILIGGLLLATGELRGTMAEPVANADGLHELIEPRPIDVASRDRQG